MPIRAASASKRHSVRVPPAVLCPVRVPPAVSAAGDDMTASVAAVPWTASSVAARNSGGYEVIDLEKPADDGKQKAPGGADAQPKREAVGAPASDHASKRSRLGSGPVRKMTEDEFLEFLDSGKRPAGCEADRCSDSGRARVGEGSSVKSEPRLPRQSDPQAAGAGAGAGAAGAAGAAGGIAQRPVDASLPATVVERLGGAEPPAQPHVSRITYHASRITHRSSLACSVLRQRSHGTCRSTGHGV